MNTGFFPRGGDPSSARSLRVQSTGQKTVYVVDDAADQLYFVALALEQAGYPAIMQTSFSGFAREFEPESCEAVMIDVHIGENDAIDVLDFVRRTNCKAPLFLTSGDPDGMASAQRYAEEVGLKIAECIPKPFSSKQLLAALERNRQWPSDIFQEGDIDESIRMGWIYPVLQPKLDLASGEIRSAELLSRMAHPRLGIVGPQDFIDKMTVAQSQTLVLHQIALVRKYFDDQWKTWTRFQVSINVDARDFVQLRTRINEMAASVQNFYRNVIFEVTEEKLTMMSDDQLKSLYKMTIEGARFSIDDFGRGFSNFERLSRFPFFEIKIDRSIVQGCARAPARKVMVKSIINMAHELGAKIVAEGVESIDDFQFLADADCDEVQGYLISRPLKLHSFWSFVTNYGNAKSIVRRSGPVSTA
jgi:EAL domain-containing protein (putative c-di-GMP-specific phosphodiesterase class I)